MYKEGRSLKETHALLKKVISIKDSLVFNGTQLFVESDKKSIDTILNDYINLISQILDIRELDELYEDAIEVRDSVFNLKMYKITIHEFQSRVNRFINCINEEIRILQNQEKADRLFYFLKELADNSDQIAKYVDIDSVFNS